MRARRAWQSLFYRDCFVAPLLAMTRYLLRLYQLRLTLRDSLPIDPLL